MIQINKKYIINHNNHKFEFSSEELSKFLGYEVEDFSVEPVLIDSEIIGYSFHIIPKKQIKFLTISKIE